MPKRLGGKGKVAGYSAGTISIRRACVISGGIRDSRMNLERLKLKLTAVFEPAPEGGYTCHFDELPEVFSEGETLEDAKTNLLDPLTQVMESHREAARKISSPATPRQ